MAFTERGMTFERLDDHLRRAKSVPLSPDLGRFIILSDAHKWDRSAVDLFRNVERVYLNALKYYDERNFTLVLLGDIEEGAGDRLRHVLEKYPLTLASEAKFLPDRYLRVYGNHDHDWKKDEFREHLDAAMGTPVEVHPSLLIGDNILVVHGHEGDFFSDELHGFTQIVLRAFKKLFESLQGHSRTTAENSRLRDRRAKLLYKWGKRNGMLVVAGHTHSAYFESISLTRIGYKLVQNLEKNLKAMPQSGLRANALEKLNSKKQSLEVHDPFWKKNHSLPKDSLPLYFNAGCCRYDDGLTGIEIADGRISLIKWTSTAWSDPKREVLAFRRISDIVDGMAKGRSGRRPSSSTP